VETACEGIGNLGTNRTAEVGSRGLLENGQAEPGARKIPASMTCKAWDGLKWTADQQVR
jgi:hypothetical protein